MAPARKGQLGTLPNSSELTTQWQLSEPHVVEKYYRIVLTTWLVATERLAMMQFNPISTPINHACPQETVSILHELDLGRHTLFIMDDGSIDLLVNDEQTTYLADNGMTLNSDETYRLFVSLQEQFQRKDDRA